MKIWSVKTENDYIEIAARSITRDILAPNVIWADGIRIAFGVQVIYIEEL